MHKPVGSHPPGSRRGPACRAGWALAASLLALGAASCEDKDDPLKRKRTASGEYITRVRGIAGHKAVPELEGAPRPLGGGAVARILIQPLEERLTQGRYIWALYLAEPKQVNLVRQALRSAPAAPHRTCTPTWRVDLRYAQHEHVALVNLPCERLVLDGRPRAFEGQAAKVLRPLLQRASRRPDHKILRVRVPVAHDPKPILKTLAMRAIEAYLPEKPARLGPVVRMSYSVLQRPPVDPTRLDTAVAELRRDAFEKLRAYGRSLKIGRHEVVAVLGPETVRERFNDRVFEAKYAVTVLFAKGTPEYMLGFLGLGNNFQVSTVTFPKHYRVDVVFDGKSSYRRMKKALTWVKVDPPVRLW